MKLTKAQRLFVAVGRADNEMQYYKYLDSVVEPHICDGYGEEIKKLRARRKRLIREALEAANNEWWAAYEEGEKEGLAKATFGLAIS